MGALRKGFVSVLALLVGTGVFVASGGPVRADTARGDAWSSASARDRTSTTTTATPTVPPVAQGAVADFEGRRIDLSAGWGDARACLVVRQLDIAECFRTADEMDAEVGTLQSQYAGAFSCSSPLRLYDYAAYGGRQLSFYSRGYWQNLTDYGFNDQLSSYIVGGCTSYLAEHVNGAGAWHPGATAPYSGVPWMASGWNDRVSSIYLT